MTNPTSSSNSKIVRFNVGGKIYEVARSLLEQHPDTMLARLASETWTASDATIGNEGDNSDAIFIERDSERFRYVLDYMRDGGVVKLPLTISKDAVLQDLAYYGFQDVDPSLITVTDSMRLYRNFHKYMDTKKKRLQEEIDGDERRAKCLKLVKHCLHSHSYQDSGYLSTTVSQSEGARTDLYDCDLYDCAYEASSHDTRRKLLNSLFEKEGLGLKDIKFKRYGKPIGITFKFL